MIQRKSAGVPPVERLECGLIELKFDSSKPEAMTFEGYGAVFGNIDSHGDVIQRGAFTETIREAKAGGHWPAMLSQHGAFGLTSEDQTPIGVWTDMEEDETGLYLKGRLAPTPRGSEMYTLMKMEPRPAINGLSIGYRAIKFKMRDKPEEPRRTLTQVKLVETSLVTYPANSRARVSSVKNGAVGVRLAEQALRDVGFSQSEAKAIVAGGFKNAHSRRDVGRTEMDDLAAFARDQINHVWSK